MRMPFGIFFCIWELFTTLGKQIKIMKEITLDERVVTMKIGIFDSGIGGVTVLKKALEMLPSLEYVYYSDNNHVPYGTKTKEEVIGYVNEVIEFLIDQKVEAIVIACNTATSIAVNLLRERYNIPIIGMEPAVKLALENSPRGKILVTATQLTLKEDKYKTLLNRIHGEKRVSSLALPELVTYAEAFIFDEDILIPYFKEKLSGYNLEDYSGIVLGCTHFVYFKKILEKMLPKHIKVYDGNEGTIRHLKSLIGHIDLEDNQSDACSDIRVEFYYSDKKDETNELLNKYLEIL